VLSTGNPVAPLAPDNAGALVGPTLTPTNLEPSRIYMVSVTPLSSNALLAATVLNRLIYGPTPDELDHIATIGPQQFIDEQLAFDGFTENLDTDPPITNTPPAPPPLTNWIRVSATGTTALTNCMIYMNARGRVYLDDIRVVLGTNADSGWAT
jgi:hypothetical protein